MVGSFGTCLIFVKRGILPDHWDTSLDHLDIFPDHLDTLPDHLGTLKDHWDTLPDHLGTPKDHLTIFGQIWA